MITLTPIALNKIRELIQKRNKPTLGIKIGIKTKGCNGLSYSFEYCDEVTPYDEKVQVEDILVVIDPKAIMFILGTEIDWKDEKLKSGFVFNNPQKKGECGCGESFNI
jgi:iron-sulfur cluster assembly protein